MYLQFKQGLVEADRWDGGKTSSMGHTILLEAQEKNSGGLGVVVCRSRERETLQYMLESVALQGNGLCQVQESPKGWDYEFRCYLTTKQFQMILCQVAFELDYRNFKSWHTTKENSGPTRSARTRLAHDIWHAAHDALGAHPVGTRGRLEQDLRAEMAEDFASTLPSVPPAKCVHGKVWKECVACGVLGAPAPLRTPDKVRAAKLRTTRVKARRDGAE